jgi:hypothetical protein
MLMDTKYINITFFALFGQSLDIIF